MCLPNEFYRAAVARLLHSAVFVKDVRLFRCNILRSSAHKLDIVLMAVALVWLVTESLGWCFSIATLRTRPATCETSRYPQSNIVLMLCATNATAERGNATSKRHADLPPCISLLSLVGYSSNHYTVAMCIQKVVRVNEVQITMAIVPLMVFPRRCYYSPSVPVWKSSTSLCR
jgi:hypothetical protein